MKPYYLAAAHRRLCQAAQCRHLESLDYADPYIGCPDGHYFPHLQRPSGSEAEPALPSIPALVHNAAGAISQVIRRGAKWVTREEFERRTAICKACEFYRASDNRCAKCGCRLNYKPLLAAWHCPVQKW